jgi:predicted RNase H-like HicB family nuclease
MKKQLRRTAHEYTAVFEPDEEQGGYTVYIPALPGCISEGDTFEQAADNIREAAALYLEVTTCTE